MKYIKTFESYKDKKNEPINEELFGGIINFLKGMWGKAVEEIKKLGEKPTIEQLDTWIEENIFNRNSNSYLFKSVMDEFKKKTEANTEDCLTLVQSIIDPDLGALGKQGLSPLYDSLMKAFGKNLGPLSTIKYYFSTSRNKAIAEFKYAGGPNTVDPKTLYVKVDGNKKIMDINNQTHIPALKAILKPLGDGADKAKKDATVKWVEGVLLPRLLKYIQDIKKEDVQAYAKIEGIEEESTTTKDSVELFWVDKSVELSPDGDNKGYYKISKSSSGKILLGDLVKISGNVEKGTLAKLSDVIRNGQKVPEFEETPYETASISKIMVGGVEKDNHTFASEVSNNSEEKDELVKTMATVDPKDYKLMSDVAAALKDPIKLADITKALSGENPV